MIPLVQVRDPQAVILCVILEDELIDGFGQVVGALRVGRIKDLVFPQSVLGLRQDR
jgi:hypothetical protein